MTLTCTISYMLRTASTLASVLALATAAGATPIPNDPFAAPVPAFVGAPATPRPVPAPAIPQQNAECGSLTFDSAGRIVTICVGLEGPRLAMFDPVTLD